MSGLNWLLNSVIHWLSIWLSEVKERLEMLLTFWNILGMRSHQVESKEHSRQLMEAYERTLALAPHPNLATALITLDGLVIQGNQRLYELLQLSDRSRFNIESFIHPEDVRIDFELKRQLLAESIPTYSIEKRFISKEHETLWVQISISLIKVPNSLGRKQKYYAWIVEDITENRRIYHALVRTEEKWKSFVLNSHYLFIQLNNSGQIIYISPAVENLLGYQEAELVGRSVTELIYTKDVTGFEIALQQWMNHSQVSYLGQESWWQTKAGQWVCLYLQGHRFPSTLELDGIVMSGYNITHRKRLEMDLKTSQEHLESLVLNVPGIVFRCNARYQMKFISHEIQRVTGYAASTFMNGMQSFMNQVHPGDRLALAKSVMHLTASQNRCSMNYRMIHANGDVCWMFERKQGVFDPQGNLLWLDGILLDVSDRYR
jgi:PAS domain S-box-containing protein